MKKILLIDGHSILNRTFYGIPDLTDQKGFHTNAIYGFLGILFKLLDDIKPEMAAVAFDMHGKTFRHDRYDAYKGNRKPAAPEFSQQVPVMKDVLKAMNIACVEKQGYEADDLIGTLSKKANENGIEAVVVSGDRDLLQLVSDHTTLYIPKTKGGSTTVEVYDPERMLETYQVTPEQFIDVKALMGDSSDNIPGVPKIGEKTAISLIKQYGSIDGIYEDLDSVKPERIKLTLEENRELCDLCRYLVTIDRDAPLDIGFDSLILHDLFNEKAYGLYTELGFKKYLERFDGVKTPDGPDIIAVDNINEFKQITGRDAGDRIGVAFLYTDCDANDGQMSLFDDGNGLIISFADESGCYVFEAAGNDKDTALSLIEGRLKKASEIDVLNVKSVLPYLGSTANEKIRDCVIGAYILNPLRSDPSAYDIALEYAGVNVTPEKDLIKKAGKDAAEIKKAETVICAMNSYIAYKSWPVIEKKLMEENEDRIFYEIEMPVSFILYEMEKEGITVDKTELKKYGDKLKEHTEELAEKIYEEAGEEFNILSPKQLGHILFEKLGLPGGRKNKTGYSTAADILEKLRYKNAIVDRILEYRQYTKLYSTYVEGMGAFIKDDGKIHTRFNQTVTATGRLSSSDPNLQNIPTRTDLGRRIRKCFIPDHGNVFVDADYSQIELRILAHMSGDETLIEDYNRDRDIHQATASKVFKVPYDEVTPELRRNAKAVNFGIVYGISSFGLGQDLSISTTEAKEYIDEYFKTYPGVKNFLDGLVASAKETGNAVTMYGRKRPVPELKDSNFMKRSFGERIAMNSPIQGSAADIMKIAMINVYESLQREVPEAKIILQIHDELLIECPEDKKETVKEIVVREMEGAADLKVRLAAECNWGDNWYEVK